MKPKPTLCVPSFADCDEQFRAQLIQRMKDKKPIDPTAQPASATEKTTTQRSLRECAEWLSGCLKFGWKKSDLDELEKTWWRFHDHTGRLIPSQQPVLPSATGREDFRTLSRKEQLLERVASYLGNGGLFNPEHMEHEKVRDLVMDLGDYLEAQKPVLQSAAGRDARDAIEKGIDEHYGWGEEVTNHPLLADRIMQRLQPLLAALPRGDVRALSDALQSIRTQCMAPGHAEVNIECALHATEKAIALLKPFLALPGQAEGEDTKMLDFMDANLEHIEVRILTGPGMVYANAWNKYTFRDAIQAAMRAQEKK